MVQVLWKAYIDFEIEQQATERVRRLYERLLEKTKHIKVGARCRNDRLDTFRVCCGPTVKKSTDSDSTGSY